MSNKHTPGPWEVLQEESDKDYLRIRGSRLGERYKIANVHDRQFKYVNEFVRQLDHAESIANARLIAAAPDLLDVAQSILTDDMLQYLPAEYIARVRAVIARSTWGES